MRYGTLGADALSVAHKMGIGFGAVFLYCKRVTRAFRELGLQVLRWGDNERHNESKAHFGQNGFNGCIGVVDGSLIRLGSMPRLQGLVYLCRKKYPAVSVTIHGSSRSEVLTYTYNSQINVQAIVDHLLRFINFEGGWPGSVTDVTIWKKSHVWTHRHEYFQPGEYLLADKGKGSIHAYVAYH